MKHRLIALLAACASVAFAMAFTAVPAGAANLTMTAEVLNGDLHVTVSGTGRASVHVGPGLNGNQYRVHMQIGSTHKVEHVSGVSKNAEIHVAGSLTSTTVRGVSFPGQLNLLTEDGRNTFDLTDVEVGGRLLVAAGDSNDTLSTSHLDVLGGTEIYLGLGKNSVIARNGQWNGDAVVRHMDNRKSLRFVAISQTFDSDLWVTGANHYDQIFIRYSDIGGRAEIETGAGRDLWTIRDTGFGDRADFLLGAGHDRLDLADVQFGGLLTVEAGGGNDLLRALRPRLVHADIDLQAGNDDMELSYAAVTGTISVDGGSGADELVLDGNDFDHGLDLVSIDATQL